MGKFIDLTGQRFGRLTVIKRVEDHISPSGRHSIQWMCLCDCQKQKSEDERKYIKVSSSHLRSGHSTSCGCKLHETLLKRNQDMRKSNIYDLSGEYGIGYTDDGSRFFFDLEDYEKIKKYKWHSNTSGYIATKTNKKYLQLHRFVMNAKLGQQVDHIHHNIKDCRKSELRIVTASQNMQNRGVNKNNSSGKTGVSFHKGTNKWISYIQVNKKHIHLGSFENINDAILAREQAEKRYFGEYRYVDVRRANV